MSFGPISITLLAFAALCGEEEAGAALDRSQLEAGEEIALFDGVEVESPAQLEEMLAERCPGQQARLTLLGPETVRELIVNLLPVLPRAPSTRSDGARQAALSLVLDRPEPKPRWYGWQTLIADGASFALLFAGGVSDSQEVMGLSVVSFALASPTIHVAHGNPGRTAISAALRIGLPAMSYFAWSEIGCLDGCRRGFFDEQLMFGVMGALVGSAAAAAIDGAGLAWEPSEED